VNILNAFSLILRYISILLLIPCICALILKEYASMVPFIGTSLISFGLGYLFKNKNQQDEEFNNLGKTDAIAIVLLTWGFLFVLGAVPFIYFGLNPVDALFESVSGVTATGATILSDFSLYPKAMFFWRSFSQWIGGLGILVLFTAILPQFSIAGRQMFFTEVPGSKENKLTPRIRQTAAALWGVYFILTLLEVVVLSVLDMPLFDAICTSFSTIAGGGFSPQSTSIIAYGSSKIVWAVGIFMFFAGFNFALQYKVFFKGKIKDLIKDEEFRAYFLIVLLFTLFIAVTLTTHYIYDFTTAIRNAFFQVLSIITTSGFASVDYNEWNLRAKLFLFLLMFSGASIGSATGGIKILRLVLIFKYMKRQIAKIHHPNGVYPIKINKMIVDEDVVKQMISFVFFYYGIFVVTAVAIVFIEQDSITGVSAAIATLGNIGPGFGSIIGPMGSYADLQLPTKIIAIFNMFVGRLELIPFLALLHPDFWSVKKINYLHKK
ncbi:TrkH family potassium uptake protein, partial [bacterium]|nr:TrkH family potassium uptake protein [bacterium]